ncbi:MAG: hypothetical protein ACRDFW_14590 [bacterium]
MKSRRVERTTAVQQDGMTTTPPSLEPIRQWMDQQFQPAKITVQDERSPEGVRYQVEQGSPSPTLYVRKDVLDAHPAEDIIAALNHHHVAARLRSDPIAHLMCVASTAGIVVVRHHRWRRGV